MSRWTTLDDLVASIPDGASVAVLGAYATTRSELEVALELTAAAKVTSCVSEIVPRREAARAHFRLENREIAGRVVLDHGAA